MFIIETYTVAVIFSIITMICWGSWPNTQKLTGKNWRFELFYWDYVFGILCVTILLSFTLGSSGHTGRSFLEDMQQADAGNMLSAFAGGVIFNAANIVFVAAIAIAGMTVAFPVAAGFGMVLGVLINYIAVPYGNVLCLFGGVALIVLAIILSTIAYKRLSKQQNKVSAKGLLLTLVAGLLFGFFYRFIASAMSTDFQLPEKGKLGPYSATVCFALGVLGSNFIFNTILMKRPVQGDPVKFSAYFKGRLKDHLMGIFGGMIWGGGLVFSILSAGKAGFAISFGLGQGNAMIAAIWGIFMWKEFKEAPVGTSKLLYCMFISYLAGLLLIIYAKN